MKNDLNKSLEILEELLEDVKAIEPLEKACPRCGKSSANSSNPSGRCSACLKKLKTAKKTPGHWQRAQTKADDALRRQNGDTPTSSHKSSGRGTRKSIVKQIQSAEKKTGEKLSPDRKNNDKGYAASNTRAVPEKLNRGRHTVDSKKLADWNKRKKMKKSDDIEKSNYKGYTTADNVKRKAKNIITDKNTGIQSMNRTKKYGGSGPSAAQKEANNMKRKSAANPVKYTHKHPETGEMVTKEFKNAKAMNQYIKQLKEVVQKSGLELGDFLTLLRSHAYDSNPELAKTLETLTDNQLVELINDNEKI